ncbi:B3 domain-containing protein [Hordeum vulgare]|nr:B3 domain-containing protein [Hordeum vulgare]
MALTAALGSRGAEQDQDGGDGNGGNGNGRGGGEEMMIMREHMFDKVVTPSDVGKLNRLVVPKHFAERHLLPRLPGGGAAGAACPGAVLRFEDGRGGGKAWAFRFSYWSSSQSYVITKGWSSFVRDRRLAAGDTVSFCRAGARLFIDCRKRGAGAGVASAPTTSLLVPVALPQQATSDEGRAPRGRRLRLFGVDLELAGAE